MFFIPGFMIAILTFPGVMVHEIAHRFFCDIFGVPVYEVCYFRVAVTGPSGYVIHGEVNKLSAAFWIAVGPFIINTFLCALIAFPAVLAMRATESMNPLAELFLLWVSISIGMHAFPSKQDLDNFHAQIKAGKNSLLLVPSFFMQAFFGLARLLSFFWFDAIYAVFVAMFIPLVLAGNI